MPNEAVQRGTLFIEDGDPRSPLYPSRKEFCNETVAFELAKTIAQESYSQDPTVSNSRQISRINERLMG